MTEFHAGDTVGGYRLEARLGGGGFGTVWRARRIADGLLVAIKLLPESGAADDRRLRADVELLAASAAGRSQHVVQVLDGGVEPVPFVVMEFIQGTSLADELRQRQRLPQQEAIEIGLGIADALKALNEAGITHRDVKPSNVMIDRNGAVKLTDFGIAKIAGFDAVTLTGQLPLSIQYAAPEVWEGRAEHRSDLYALAIVLYQCLTGLLPFRGAYAELFYQHRNKEPDLAPLPPDTVPALLELISACLQKTPEERPASATACIELLRKARDEVLAQDARPVDAPAGPREPQRFGPWIKGEQAAGDAWAWHARHETSGQEAVVEVHFAASTAYGEELRRAVAANPRLVPLGAQRVFQSNRLIFRPGEAWPEPAPAPFQFWVAREDIELPQTPARVHAGMALRTVETLAALIEATREEGLPLELTAPRLSLRADGGVYLRHPAFPLTEDRDPEADALAYLRGLPLTRDVRPIVTRATSLDDLRKALAVQAAVRPVQAPVVARDTVAGGEAASQPSRMPLFVGLGAFVVLAVIFAIAALTLLQEDGTPGTTGPTAAVGTPQPTPIVPRPPQVQACLDAPLPAPITNLEGVCGGGVAQFAFDATCPRGQACNRNLTGDVISIGMNDQTVAFIDRGGNLVVAREDGSNARVLTQHGQAHQPAWSHDGRYIAYLSVLPLEPEPITPTPGAPLPEQRWATQLHIIDVDKQADDSIVLATNAALATPPGLQRYVSSPQWAPDGRSLYFLSQPIVQPGGFIQSVDLPISGQSVDYGRLRSRVPANEPFNAGRVSTVSLNGSDFGLPLAYLGRFAIRADGQIVTQYCDGDRTRQSCGLGRWDGRASTLVALERDVIVEAPAAWASDGVAYVRRSTAVESTVLRLPADGPAAPAGLRLPPVDPQVAPFFASRTHLSVNRNDGALLVEGTGVSLSGIALADGAASAWGSGSSPVWFAAAIYNRVVQPPPSQPFTVPTPEPSPTVVPTATPRPLARQMTINVTVSRDGASVAGATVVASVGGDECSRGNTDSAGRLSLLFPRDLNAPARCTEPNAQIRFQVNGQQMDQTTSYNPQSTPSFNLPLR